MTRRRLRLRAVPMVLAIVLVGLAVPSPAQAAFTGTATTATTAVTSATLQPPLAVVLPGTALCFGTVTVTWTPSVSFVVGALTGFLPAGFSYLVTLKRGASTWTKTVTGGASATTDFTSLTILGSYTATVQTSYGGWTSSVTSSLIARTCAV